MSLRNLVENKDKLDYKALTTSLINEFGITDAITWDAVIPANVQQNLFGGETLRLFSDHPNFATQKDIRTILLKKGQTSQLLILFAKLKDEKLSKQNIEKVTKKFIGGSAAERYVVWFIGNPSNTEFKVVLSGKEGKKIVLKTLPFGINQPYYKTYDFILEEVHKKVSHFFVEPNELWKALWKSFDISVVNKKFYLDIKSAFDSLINDEIFKGSIRIEEARKQFAVRLIGRLIFSWFLKKKGIISENVLSSSAVYKYENYYLEFLEKLFFEVFNTPQKERGKLPDEIKDYPFLNGGLFESQIGDYGDYQGKVFIKNDWFENLFKNTLEKYNFTIDENTSSSSEIAIDPEMLGRIFENLLAEQNPETQESARKSTGSYYTPREIVDYMVEQSVSEYLKSNVTLSLSKGDDSALNPASLSQSIEDFVHTEELTDTLKPYSTQILEELNTVKVLDPACGSGAFPIGMLQKLIALKLQIKPHPTLPFGKGEGKGGVYDLKLQTILNSIYGCDIQPMAVELSRLRCWLSLIIDEDVDKKKDNWGIVNLPNLDFKFVCVNTLIGLPKMVEDSLGTSADDFEKLKQLREEFFTASAKRKLQIEKEFKTLQGSIAEKQREWSTKNTEAVTMLINWNPFKVEKTDWFDPFWMFGIKDGFDIVIGNPPFVEHKKLKAFRENIKNQNYVTHSGSADLYVYFYERSIKLLKQKGILAFISSNKFFKTNYGALLRDYISKLETISIVDFTDYHVFDALVASCVYLLRKDKPKQDFIFVNIKEDFQDQNVYSYLEENKIIYPSSLLKGKYWQFDDFILYNLKTKIENVALKIDEIKSVAIYRGVTTGFNDAFIISEKDRVTFLKNEPSLISVIKPLLQGRDIKRWGYTFADTFLLFIPWHFPLHKDTSISGASQKAEEKLKENYPFLYTHLLSYQNELMDRNKEETGIRYEWYTLQRCAATYYDEFDKDKIVWGLTADKWAFAYDDKKHYLPSNGYILTSSEINLKYILGVLNSSLMQFYFRFIGVMTAGGAYTLKHQTINELPLKIPNSIEELRISEIVDKILSLKQQNPQANTKQLENQMDIMVYKLYNLTYEEVKIIDPEIEKIISKEEYEKFEIK